MSNFKVKLSASILATLIALPAYSGWSGEEKPADIEGNKKSVKTMVIGQEMPVSDMTITSKLKGSKDTPEKSAQLDGEAEIIEKVKNVEAMKNTQATEVEQILAKKLAQQESKMVSASADSMKAVALPFPDSIAEASDPGMTYEQAVKRLVPLDWSVAIPKPFADQPVSFERGSSKGNVLKQLVADMGGSIQFIDSSKSVVHYVYGVGKRESLRDALDRWGDISGWVVDFQIPSVDFISSSQSWFGDDFKASVKLLEKSFKTRGAMTDFQFIFTEPGNTSDNVLTIKRNH